MPVPNVSPNAGEGSSSPQPERRTLLSSLTSFFLFLFERITPDPYIFAVVLTILTASLAAIFAPKGSAEVILSGWYNGLFSILAFAFQMVLVLVTGYALSNSAPVREFLARLAGIATTPKRAIVVIVTTVMVTSFVNWGCGWWWPGYWRGKLPSASGLISAGSLLRLTPAGSSGPAVCPVRLRWLRQRPARSLTFAKS